MFCGARQTGGSTRRNRHIALPITGVSKDATRRPLNASSFLAVCNFLSKGWEVSILGFLAFIQRDHHLPLYAVGILSTVFIVSQISISFFAGKIAHAVHSRNVILLAIAAGGLAWLGLLEAHHPIVLYLSYAFGGVSSGLFEPIGNSLVAKLSTANKRGAAIGNFAAFGDMGRIALVAVSSALAGLIGVNRACGVLFGSAIVALVLAKIFLRRAVDNDQAESERPVHITELLRNTRFCHATAAGIADSFSSASLYIFIPFLLNAKGIALADTLYFNVIFFAGYMLGRLAMGRLADRHGTANTLMFAKVGMAILILFLTLVSGYTTIIILLFVLGIFTRGSSPIIRAMVADSMDENTSFHDAFSTYSFASRGSSAVCRPIYGFLASYAGIAWVFYAASAVSMLTLYPARRYKHAKLASPSPQASVSTSVSRK